MDFISNLIKRPISLVLNDSATTTTEQANTISSPTPILSSSSSATTTEHLNENSFNSLPSTTMNSSFHKDTIQTANTTAPVPVSLKSILNPTSLDSSSSSSPSSNTANTIEELLLQINDNLSQATLSDEEPIAESELNSTAELTPKPTTVKMSPSPRPESTTANISAATSPAAGSTGFEKNSALHKFHTESELEAELSADSSLSGQNSTAVNKSPNKFIGLTEFDESKIPELPGCLNANIADHLKLTFEAGLIPTLTANINTNTTTKKDDMHKTQLLVYNETDTAASSDNETFTECHSFLEPSSKHELTQDELTMEISEAEAYRSALNSNNTIDISNTCEDPLNATMENVAELIHDNVSVESPRKNINNSYEAEPMDIDMNVTLDVQDSANSPKLEHSITSNDTVQCHTDAVKIEQNHSFHAADSTTQGDSNDQSLNSTDKSAESYNSTVEQLDEQHNENVKALVDSSVVDTALAAEQTENKHDEIINENSIKTQCDNQDLNMPFNINKGFEVLARAPKLGRSTYSIAIADENVAKHTQPSLIPSVDIEQTLNKLSFVTSNELVSTEEANKAQTTCTEDNISDEKVENTPTITGNNTINNAVELAATSQADKAAKVETLNTNITVEEIKPIAAPASVVKSLSDKENDKLNLTLDMHSSFSSAKNSAPTSPTFPLKQGDKLNLTLDMHSSFSSAKNSAPTSPTFPLKQGGDMKRFPSSPSIAAKEKHKKMPFLEKSDYAEPSNATRKISTEQSPIVAQILVITATPPKVTEAATTVATIVDDNTNSGNNNTLPQATENSITTALQASLDDDIVMPSTKHDDALVTTPTDLEHDIKEKRRTFNMPAEQSLIDKRRTFNLPAENDNIALNDCIEPMDVDDSMQLPTPRPASPPIPTHQKSQHEAKTAATPLSNSPPLPTMLKRPPIHINREPFVKPSTTDVLSAKEQIKCNTLDEKDIFVDKFVTSPMEDMFSVPSNFRGFEDMASGAPSTSVQHGFGDDDFQCGNIILNPSDFDYLLTKGNNNVEVDRSSLLIRFDPLLGVPVPVNQPQQQQHKLQQILNSNNNTNLCLKPTIEEDEHLLKDNKQSFIVETKRKSFGKAAANTANTCDSAKLKERATAELEAQQLTTAQEQQQQTAKVKKHARMSVDVIKDMNIDNDCNKSFENSNSQSDEKDINYKMDDLEKKIKNEVLKEDIEKKLKEAEQREEALIRRITEKDKSISKMNGVIESYEKTIAELVREKEQLTQNYEKQMAEIKADRDSNYHHLTSLETTFSDLHVKYEKSKEMTVQLKASEESLLAKDKQNLENLRLQEQRYDKMKNHAMQQLEIANKKLESLTREHAFESTKLKALLKKEEISRASISEQLLQKSRENAELVKICDELINGQGS